MKKILMAAAAVSTLAATPVLAAESAEYAVTGTVNNACTIAPTGTVAFGALTSATGAFNAVKTSAPVDTTAYCNQAGTTVDIAHTKMTTAGSAVGFANEVEFTPGVSFSGRPDLGDGTGQAVGAFTSMQVSATPIAPTSPLKSGSYTGSITITLHPLA